MLAPQWLNWQWRSDCVRVFSYSRSSFVNEAVDRIPPLSLSVCGQQAKERKREAARLKKLQLLLLVNSVVDLCSFLQLTVATKYHTMYKHLEEQGEGLLCFRRSELYHVHGFSLPLSSVSILPLCATNRTRCHLPPSPEGRWIQEHLCQVWMFPAWVWEREAAARTAGLVSEPEGSTAAPTSSDAASHHHEARWSL